MVLALTLTAHRETGSPLRASSVPSQVPLAFTASPIVVHASARADVMHDAPIALPARMLALMRAVPVLWQVRGTRDLKSSTANGRRAQSRRHRRGAPSGEVLGQHAGAAPQMRVWRKSVVLLALASAFSASWATSAEDRAVAAQAADAGSTVLGVAAGLAEVNPIGPAVVLLKPALLNHCRAQKEEDRADCFSATSAVGGGAAVNNVCMLLAFVFTAGAAAPACPLMGVAWGMHDWNQTDMEREFWAICRKWRSEHGPDIKCTYTPPQPTKAKVQEAKGLDNVTTALPPTWAAQERGS